MPPALPPVSSCCVATIRHVSCQKPRPSPSATPQVILDAAAEYDSVMENVADKDRKSSIGLMGSIPLPKKVGGRPQNKVSALFASGRCALFPPFFFVVVSQSREETPKNEKKKTEREIHRQEGREKEREKERERASRQPLLTVLDKTDALGQVFVLPGLWALGSPRPLFRGFSPSPPIASTLLRRTRCYK